MPRAQWGPLAQRVDALLLGQYDLIADGLDPTWEALAEQYVARLVGRLSAPAPAYTQAGHYQRVDLDRVEVVRPRSVGDEYVAQEALRRLGLDVKLGSWGSIAAS